MNRMQFEGLRSSATDPAQSGSEYPANMSLVLVVASAPVNRIVVSSIVERAGLKAVACDPREAPMVLAQRGPGMVILDAGSDNSECQALLGELSRLRGTSGGKLPLVIVLSTATGAATPDFRPGAVDAVVAKPITPEGLQPVISRLIEQAG